MQPAPKQMKNKQRNPMTSQKPLQYRVGVHVTVRGQQLAPGQCSGWPNKARTKAGGNGYRNLTASPKLYQYRVEVHVTALGYQWVTEGRAPKGVKAKQA